MDDYTRSSRPSKRHKFKAEAQYSRYTSHRPVYGVEKLGEPPFPEDVAEEARQQIIAKINVLPF